LNPSVGLIAGVRGSTIPLAGCNPRHAIAHCRHPLELHG
jgi:hypothetical protein